MPAHVPERGDLIWIEFDPVAGHEQGGRRPAVVISTGKYNLRSGLALVCPVTTKEKGYPYEAALPSGLPVKGVVLADHIRSLDWKSRKFEFIAGLPEKTSENIIALIEALLK